MPVPHDRPTFSQIMHALRVSGESGDILCTHAAEEIERLRLTDDERLAIRWVVGEALSVDGVSIQATLRGLLERTK